MMDTNVLTIVDDSGQERNVEVILTFEDDSRHKSYVLFKDPMDPEENVYAYCYDEDGNMNEVDDEEWEMCQEVLGAFMDEEETNG